MVNALKEIRTNPGRPLTRNFERTLSLVTEMWIDGKSDSEIIEKLGWGSVNSMNQYFLRHGYSMKELRDSAMEKKREIVL